MNKDFKTERLEIMRHSCSHLMAAAVKNLWPQVKFGIGPAIENGFYYDFGSVQITSEDLSKIEKKMKEIKKQNLRFERKEMTIAAAEKLFKKLKQPYKLELIKELKKEGNKKVTIYKLGDFIDLCSGPHVETTRHIGPFKLLSLAGAYWQGDEKNPMLTRIYGTAFSTQTELDDYLKLLEEAEKRDHRKLSKELDLYSTSEEVGQGLIIWHPKGAAIRQVIEDFWKEEHQKRGYQYVYTPHIGRLNLWKKSGHWEFYRENMYSPMEIDKVEYELKPMNCPFHIQIFKSKLRSYRDLPLRYCELGTVYRYERAGVLHGLVRVRGFTQDDAHIFCTEEQLEDEIVNVLEFAKFMLETFGFSEYKMYLSTKPEKAAGSARIWKIATEALKKALERAKQPYEIDPGEGVFYGPKIDVKLKDVLGREWQGPTIQVDFNFPQKFDINYIGPDGQKQQVVMIHRTVLGSMERFIGVLMEHYGGIFPLWLAPIQIILLPLADRHFGYCQNLANKFKNLGLRIEINERNETINKKIREAELQKIPYMLIVGDKEMENKTISVRSLKKKDLGQMEVEKFIKIVQEEIEKKALDKK